MPIRQRRRLRFMPLNSLIPNMLTMLALCAGLTSVRFSLDEKWEMAVIAILAAGVLDGLDGRMARLLKSSSRFGAELDSLSDFVSFGVAPGLVLFLWTLESGLGGVGWIIALIFTVSCALRLARFNSMLDEEQPAWASRYFTGIAAPAGASISLLFMVMHFYTESDFFRSAILNAGWILFMAFMMASRIPTFSIKRVRIARRFIMPVLLLVGGLAAVLASYPWQLLSLIAIVYMATIPFSILSHRRLQEQENRKNTDGEISDAIDDDDEEEKEEKA
ncbi:CDP-alcohol phosphatidyltransferase family protein [Sneathiella sp. HT1-7]|jgi:CDP-diacylglycerol--serine O-phosphatidyltransferase|uniref:CDP-alcohol phosphatidyltransferase family protein n=1 Tax=Sneathiella sp. HT1-7 TaxID=2887192 RepID=UPI001D13800E|nr:phosphatidylcholine/phosphatidylserine synthase [Sneathiella sp. HT1-7]MCC3306259.1 phosphatidylcholine/phosphatidylserine synthase [Sneathiella sp. HT1-7]